MAQVKLDFTRMPLAGRIFLSVLPAILISAGVVILLILPKNKEVKRLSAEITKQENQIAADQVKASKLETLKAENAKLKKRLDELKLQLPEEKEVTSLLKQVSDLGIKAGLKTISWKPEQKKDHPSGIIYEIPVSVELSGAFHNLGIFFSSLTKLNRIVNISDIKISEPKAQRNEAILKIVFKATTFSALPEKEMEAKAAAPKGQKK